MPVINTGFRTVTCDAPGCDKTATFEATNGMPPEALEEFPWLRTNRVTQTADGRMFSTCSDVCMIKLAETGCYNSVEKQTVAPVTGGTAAIAAAAAAARRRQIADDAIRAGKPASVQLS